jgi:hypothetical protein
MTADAANLIAEIQRCGGDLKLVGRERLKLVAPKALLPELTEKVRAAKPKLLAALAGTSWKTDAPLVGRRGVLNPRLNGATAQHSTSEPSSHCATPTREADWRARHGEALAHWGAHRTAEAAALLAWSELEDRWHRLYGERAPEWQCAGCGKPMGARAALTLTDGNRVHFDQLYCILAFGGRWRREAAAGLRALGLVAPSSEAKPML